jgi:pilus assembly protein Flp/PilA
MKTLGRFGWTLIVWSDETGQDMVEYALLAGLVAVAGGLFAPDMTDGMNTIYSRLASKLEQAVG